MLPQPSSWLKCEHIYGFAPLVLSLTIYAKAILLENTLHNLIENLRNCFYNVFSIYVLLKVELLFVILCRGTLYGCYMWEKQMATKNSCKSNAGLVQRFYEVAYIYMFIVHSSSPILLYNLERYQENLF